MEIALLLV